MHSSSSSSVEASHHVTVFSTALVDSYSQKLFERTPATPVHANWRKTSEDSDDNADQRLYKCFVSGLWQWSFVTTYPRTSCGQLTSLLQLNLFLLLWYQRPTVLLIRISVIEKCNRLQNELSSDYYLKSAKRTFSKCPLSLTIWS